MEQDNNIEMTKEQLATYAGWGRSVPGWTCRHGPAIVLDPHGWEYPSRLHARTPRALQLSLRITYKPPIKRLSERDHRTLARSDCDQTS